MMPLQPHQHQAGAFSIMAAATLLMALLTLVLVIDTSRLYAEQRKLQKLADIAALESISRLASGACGTDPVAARRFAEDNLRRHQFLSSEAESAIIECVDLDTSGEIIQLIQNPNGPAVRAQVRQEVPSSLILRSGAALGLDFPATTQLQAEATAARDEPVAVFSLGAQLLRLEKDGLLGLLLNGIGLDLDTLTLLDSEGLVNAQVTPAGLLSALGVDLSIQQLKALSPEGLVELVQTQIGLLSIDELLNVSLDLITDSALRSQISTLRFALINNPILQDVELQLIGTDSDRALLSLSSADNARLGSALDSQIQLEQFISTALLIGVAEKGRSIMIPELNLLGLVDVQMGIVEPPSIGIGPVGTRAYNAQIRLYIDIDSDQLLSGSLKFLTHLLGTRIHLPIWIDLVSGKAELTALTCDLNPPQATFKVEGALLGICIGEISEELRWSTQASCQGQINETELIRLLNLPVLSGKSSLESLKFEEDNLQVESPPGESKVWVATDNLQDLGETVERLVIGLLDLLSGLFRRPTSDLSSGLDFSQEAENRLIQQLAEQYLEATKNSLGFYNVSNATALILSGQLQTDTGEMSLPPLIDSNFSFPKAIPTTYCLPLLACYIRDQEHWNEGTFSQAFFNYTSETYGLLGVVLGAYLADSPYRSCSGLLTNLLDWNRCVKHNLQSLLIQHKDRYTLAAISDGDQLAIPGNQEVSCSGALCLLLRPVLNLIKPLLNEVGHLLNSVLNLLGINLLGLELEVHSIECGTARLVR